MKIVITIPAYNEEKTIGNLIRDIKKVMEKMKHKYKIVVVDDGSTDKTVKIAKKTGALVYSHPYNYGLAETFRTEMKKSLEINADVIVHIDADYQYLPKEIPKLLKPILKKEADLVLGSRFLGQIEQMPFLKRFGNKLFSKSISNITRFKISDAQTGFRAFTRRVAQNIKITSTHTYTQEMIIRAVRQKFRIKEIPVHFAKRRSGSSRLMSNPFDFAIKAWVNIFRVYRDFEPLKFFGSLGMILLLLGSIFALYTFHGFITLGWEGIDQRIPSIIIGVLFFINGIQILLFGFLADKISRD
jgi:glycosyltransferase involved in cell wall biosynthesis